jgi:hypothetical protein
VETPGACEDFLIFPKLVFSTARFSAAALSSQPRFLVWQQP